MTPQKRSGHWAPKESGLEKGGPVEALSLDRDATVPSAALGGRCEAAGAISTV